MMGSFKQFMEDEMDGEKADIANTLEKLPDSHAALVQGYNWKFHAGNTLNGDEEHVGYMDDHEKEIAIAAPYNYGREFTVLHEIAHRVLEKFVTPEHKQMWMQIVQNTPEKQDQNAEELFCMAYANHYAKNKIVIHDHPQWHQFIENLPK